MTLSREDYPLSVKRRELIKTYTGKPFDDINLKSVNDGNISQDDLRISGNVLMYQAEIAEACERPQLAENLRRAAELTVVPDGKILEIYNALRPHRSTKQELLDIAHELETKYNAKRCAALIRKAADTYERRGVLKR